MQPEPGQISFCGRFRSFLPPENHLPQAPCLPASRTRRGRCSTPCRALCRDNSPFPAGFRGKCRKPPFPAASSCLNRKSQRQRSNLCHWLDFFCFPRSDAGSCPTAGRPRQRQSGCRCGCYPPGSSRRPGGPGAHSLRTSWPPHGAGAFRPGAPRRRRGPYG